MNLSRITVNLTPKTLTALQLAEQLGGDNRTDTVSRAVQVYAYCLQMRSEGTDLLTRDSSGETEKIVIM